MREAVVVATARTPLAKSFRGSLNMTRPDDLAAHCLRAVLERAPGVNPADVEDVILGCGEPSHQQGFNVARIAARPGRAAGHGRRARPSTAAALPACKASRWPPTRSSTKAPMSSSPAASRASPKSPRLRDDVKKAVNPWLMKHKPAMYMVMGETAEVVAKRYKIGREVQDEYALSSQQRTATSSGGRRIGEKKSPRSG